MFSFKKKPNAPVLRRSNPNLIYEASFNKISVKTCDLMSDKYASKVYKGPGILREFNGSGYLSLFFKETNALILIDKASVYEVKLDTEVQNAR